MPVYRKCTVCGKKVLEGTLCICEQKKKLYSYRDYKRRRMQNKSERERQKFYSNKNWLKLSNTIKNHYFGLCVMCLHKGLIKGSKYTHHIETLKDKYDLKYDKDNLIAVCDCCHKKIHKLYDSSDNNKTVMQKALKELIYKFDKKYY